VLKVEKRSAWTPTQASLLSLLPFPPLLYCRIQTPQLGGNPPLLYSLLSRSLVPSVPLSLPLPLFRSMAPYRVWGAL